MPTHLFRELVAAHLRTATYRPLDEQAFSAIFDQWEGERGQALWVAHAAGFDEQHTAEFEPLCSTPCRRRRGSSGEIATPGSILR